MTSPPLPSERRVQPQDRALHLLRRHRLPRLHPVARHEIRDLVDPLLLRPEPIGDDRAYPGGPPIGALLPPDPILLASPELSTLQWDQGVIAGLVSQKKKKKNTKGLRPRLLEDLLYFSLLGLSVPTRGPQELVEFIRKGVELLLQILDPPLHRGIPAGIDLPRQDKCLEGPLSEDPLLLILKLSDTLKDSIEPPLLFLLLSPRRFIVFIRRVHLPRPTLGPPIEELVREPSSELTVWAGLRRASRVVASLQRAPRLLRIA